MDETPYASTKLVGRLVAGDKAGDFRYAGLVDAGGPYVVEVAGRRRMYPLEQMTAWYRGFTDGQRHNAGELHQVPAGAGLAPLVELLTAPDLADQCRMAIRAAMDAAGLDATRLAEAADVTRKTVGDALRFGEPQGISITMAQRLMAAAGGRWHVAYVPDEQGPPADLATPVRPEPVALTRLRALALADSRDLVRWLDNLDPTAATSRRGFYLTLRVAAEDKPVKLRAAVDLVPFLLGLADAADPATAVDLEHLTGPAV